MSLQKNHLTSANEQSGADKKYYEMSKIIRGNRGNRETGKSGNRGIGEIGKSGNRKIKKSGNRGNQKIGEIGKLENRGDQKIGKSENRGIGESGKSEKSGKRGNREIVYCLPCPLYVICLSILFSVLCLRATST